MNIISRYPWPVLGDGDAVAGVFTPDAKINLGVDNIIIRGIFNLDNKTIQELIGNVKAKYTIQITCVATHFRRCYLFENNQFEITIPAQDLRGIVFLNYFVIAADDILDYKNETAHSDYENLTFRIMPGDILADGGTDKFEAKKRYAGSKNVSDFLEVIREPDISYPMTVNPAREKIIISLSSIDYDKLAKFSASKNKKVNSIIQSGLAFPAIIIAMQNAFEEQNDYQQFMWFNVLRERSEKAHIEWNKDNIYRIAQAVLEMPVERMLSGLEEISNQSED